MYNRDKQQTSLDLDNKIDAAIAMGIRRGQETAKRRRIHRRRRTGAVAALAAMILICLFSLRVSPVFAAFVREIPGMEKFVDLIHMSHDKGVQLAIDSDLLQCIGESAERDGTKFTVQGIIADQFRMVLFYDIELASDDEYAELRPDLTDIHGQSLQATISFHYPEESKEDIRKNGIQRGTLDFQLPMGTEFPDEVLLKVNLKRKPLPDPNQPPAMMPTDWESLRDRSREIEGTEFQIPFRIDQAKFADLTREFPLGQTLDIEGQKVIFDKAVISPLRVAIYMTYPSSNSKQLFGPGDIRIVDDKGIEWRHTLGHMAKDRPVLYFESPYFKKPEKLYIEGSWFRALDKDKMEATIDLDQQELLQAPDEKLSLAGVRRTDSHIRLDFELNGVEVWDRMMYSLFERTVKDAAGKRYETSGSPGISAYGDFQKQQTQLYLNIEHYSQPIKLTISNYPQYIREPYKIQIK